MMRYEPITDVAQLEAVYGAPGDTSLIKVADHLTPAYRALIEASPFFTLASVGSEGLDCSPRGERGGALVIVDEKTLIIPDRRGNNRIDTLRNIVRDPRVAILFLIPGSGTTVRLNGKAIVTRDAALLASLTRDGKEPRSAIVIAIEEVYTQCARAVLRAELWDPAHHVEKGDIPSVGDVLREQSKGVMDGATYDAEWAGRAAKTMW